MTIAERFIDENLPDHWCVNDSKESFIRLLNHLLLTTNFKIYFEKALGNSRIFTKPEGVIVADIGAGTGWTSAIMALKPEVEKVYVVDASYNRLRIAPYVAKHFRVPKEKLKYFYGTFTEPNVPENVDLVVLSGAFHHCPDSDIPVLLKNVRKMLAGESEYRYEDFLGKERTVTSKGKVLIANEHYLNRFGLLRIKLSWIKRLVDIREKGAPLNYGPGHWNDPDPHSQEHNRTKKELDAIFKREGFKVDYYEHKGSLIDRKKNRGRFKRSPLTYYYAILELM